jgi:hypothetical protein
LRLRLRLGRCGYGFRRFAFRGSFEHRRWFDRGSRERCGFRGRFFRLRRGLGHEEGGRRQEIEHLAAICGNVRCAIALAALGTATILEVGAYGIPWLDQLLDLVATPAAVAAGMLAAASVVVDLPPVLKWGAVLLAGGAAGVTQGATVVASAVSGTSWTASSDV